MVQSRAKAMPFNTVLALSALFSIGNAIPASDSSSSTLLQTRMEMPDSPPPDSPPPPPSYWNFATNGLPVSYRVAIIIDAFVLVVTIVSLCLLGWYMRKQYRRRKLMMLIHERERDDNSLGMKLRDMEEGEGEGEGEGESGRRERRKKGHVRWGSGVQGGSVDLDSLKPDASPLPSNSTSPTTPNYLKPGNRQFDLDFSQEQFDGTVTPAKQQGFGVNPLGGIGKAKSSPMAAEFKGDPLGKGKGLRLWEERERHRRVGQRVVAGYDGFRGN